MGRPLDDRIGMRILLDILKNQKILRTTFILFHRAEDVAVASKTQRMP